MHSFSYTYMSAFLPDSPVQNPPLCVSGPLFTMRQDVLPPSLAKPQSHEIGCYKDRIALKFGRHLDNGAADVPVKFQSYWKKLNPNLAASRLHEIMQ